MLKFSYRRNGCVFLYLNQQTIDLQFDHADRVFGQRRYVFPESDAVLLQIVAPVSTAMIGLLLTLLIVSQIGTASARPFVATENNRPIIGTNCRWTTLDETMFIPFRYLESIRASFIPKTQRYDVHSRFVCEIHRSNRCSSRAHQVLSIMIVAFR